MCLVAVAWRAHPRYPLIILGNRDEMHQRPSAAAAWWTDHPQVLGGRDLVAGGSWLAVSRSGRFAVVTNNPRRRPGPGRDLSRGQLVAGFVTGQQPSGRFLDAVQVEEARYAGFRLLVGTRVQVRGLVCPPSRLPGRWTLGTGVTVVSNSPWQQPWPKVRYLEQALADALAAEAPAAGQLLALLERRDPLPAEAGDDTSMAGRLPFIVGDEFGTRASTLITMDASGNCSFIERRFDAQGILQGETAMGFALE